MPNDSWMMQCALILCKKTVATASTAPLRTVSLLAEQPLTESKFSSVGMNLVNSAVLWPNCVTNFQIIFTFCRNFRVFFQTEMKYSGELAQELFRIERNAKKSIIFFFELPPPYSTRTIFKENHCHPCSNKWIWRHKLCWMLEHYYQKSSSGSSGSSGSSRRNTNS